MGDKLLEISGLNISYNNNGIKVIDGLSLEILENEILGLIGSSGSGKTTLASSITKLIPDSICKIEGEVLFNDKDILSLRHKALREIRGNKIAYIFQNATESLNPTRSIGKQITDILIYHKKLSKHQARTEALELLALVGIEDADDKFKYYPYQFSEGMNQRVMIAMAISLKPDLLIADEPISSLDTMLQHKILSLIKELMDKKMIKSVFLISHNISLISKYCNRIAVIDDGKIVELDTPTNILQNPKHPTTKKLILYS